MQNHNHNHNLNPIPNRNRFSQITPCRCNVQHWLGHVLWSLNNERGCRPTAAAVNHFYSGTEPEMSTQIRPRAGRASFCHLRDFLYPGCMHGCWDGNGSAFVTRDPWPMWPITQLSHWPISISAWMCLAADTRGSARFDNDVTTWLSTDTSDRRTLGVSSVIMRDTDETRKQVTKWTYQTKTGRLDRPGHSSACVWNGMAVETELNAVVFVASQHGLASTGTDHRWACTMQQRCPDCRATQRWSADVYRVQTVRGQRDRKLAACGSKTLSLYRMSLPSESTQPAKLGRIELQLFVFHMSAVLRSFSTL